MSSTQTQVWFGSVLRRKSNLTQNCHLDLNIGQLVNLRDGIHEVDQSLVRNAWRLRWWHV